MIRRGSIGLALLLGLTIATPSSAADPTKEQCIAANDQQQALRAQKKFRAAREAARACANTACPAIVRTDCAQAVYDLDHQIPTMVFETKDAAGHDLAAVKVTMDGQVLVDHLDGSALDVDVGEHDFVFEAAGATVRQHFIVREGDRARHERVDFPAAPKPKTDDPPMVVAPPPPATETPRSGTGQRIAGGVLGGVGIVGIVVGAVFVAKGNSGNSDLKNPEPSICPVGQGTTCQNAIDLKSEIQAQWTGGGIALGLGGGALIAGVIVFLTAPSSAARTSLVVAPSFGTNGASLALSGRF